MIVQAYGLVDVSPHQISMVLRGLNMSHTLVGGFGRTMHMTVEGLCRTQPIWPVVVDKVRGIPKVLEKRERMVYFVCDARAALSASNVSSALWPENRNDLDVHTAIKSALMATRGISADWNLVTSELSIEDFVNIASKPSYLNKIQSALYKITPYGLRKEVQELIIDYLAGAASFTTLNRKLKSSLKLDALQELLKTEKAKEFRAAVAMLKSMTVEEAAKTSGMETFELLYISSSYAKRMAAKA